MTWSGICGGTDNPAGPHYRSCNGQPCKRRVTPGHFRCPLHGSQAIASRLKAEQALAMLRLPAIEALHEVLEQLTSDVCPTCLFPTGDLDTKKVVVVTASKILDRTGLGPRSYIEVAKQSDGDLDLNLLTESERGELRALFAQFKNFKEVIRARQNGEPAVLPTTH